MYTRKKNIVKAIKLVLTGIDLSRVTDQYFKFNLCTKIYKILKAKNIKTRFTVIPNKLYVLTYDREEGTLYGNRKDSSLLRKRNRRLP
jgi:HKD family nuclease